MAVLALPAVGREVRRARRRLRDEQFGGVGVHAAVARRARTVHARDQHERAGTGADRAARSAGEAAVRLQRQSRGYGARPGARAQGSRARRPVHRRVRTGATDTVPYADVVLPATTFLEQYDFARSYGPITIQLTQPVIDPIGEARSNNDVFADLGQRLGVIGENETRGELDTLVHVLDGLPAEIGTPLKASGVATPPWDGRPVQFVDVFPRTPDQRVHLFSEDLDAEAPLGLYTFQPDPASDAFPLALISPASDRTISSTLGELPRPEVKLLLNTIDALARGIEDDDEVRVWNALGEVRCRAQVGAWVRPGTVGPAEGSVAAQHRERLHRHGAGTGHADRSRRRRLLQRRPRRGAEARRLARPRAGPDRHRNLPASRRVLLQHVHVLRDVGDGLRCRTATSNVAEPHS